MNKHLFNPVMKDIADKNLVYKHPIIGREYFKRLSFILSKIEVRDKRVLDLGFGRGMMLPYLKIKGAEVYGVEPFIGRFEEAEEVLKKHSLISKIKIFNEPGEKTHFLGEFFDIIFSVSVMEHVLDPKDLYLEVNRILKKSGLFVVLVPTENRLYSLSRLLLGISKPKDHYYNAVQIREKLSKYFLIKEEYSYYPILPFFKLFICSKK